MFRKSIALSAIFLFYCSVGEAQDGQLGETPFTVQGELGYGKASSGRLYGAKTHHGWLFEGREAAELTVRASDGFTVSLAGPEDRWGSYGTQPLTQTEAGELSFQLPEDGRYLVLIGAKLGSYELELAADQQPDARLRLNMVEPAGLEAAGIDIDDLASEIKARGLCHDLARIDADPERFSLTSHRVFFSPKTGEAAWGWSPEARARRVFVREKSGPKVRWEPGNLAAPVVDLFRRAEERIEVAMYGLGLNSEEGEALLDAAARGVQIRVYLDVASRSSNKIPYGAATILQLMEVPNVEVRVPSRTSRVQHMKFGIIDGLHAFAGSANIGTSSKSRYTEDRFIFMHSPEAAAQLSTEWRRVWDDQSQPAEAVRKLLTGE